MDIGSLYNVSSGIIQNAMTAYQQNDTTVNESNKDLFASLLNTAVESLNQTNGYISEAENEELKMALGLADNTNDLAMALQKEAAAVSYTIAIRDKFMESYRTIMNMQI